MPARPRQNVEASQAIDGLRLLAVICLVLASCTFEPLDLSGRACPCEAPFVCLEGACYPPSVDAGSADARADAPGQDAAASDADAAAPDDAALVTDAGPPITECSTGGSLGDAAFCDGFENPGAFGRWQRDVEHGSVSVVTEASVGAATVMPYRGVRMMQATMTRASSWAQVTRCPFAPLGVCPAGAPAPTDVIVDGDYYMRTYVYIPGDVPVGHISIMHAGLHRGVDPVEPPASLNVDGTDALMYIGAAGMRFGGTPPIAVPTDRWVCVQGRVSVADVGTARMWVDGALAVEVTDIDTLPDVPYLHFGLGIAWTSLQEPITIFFDEVGVSRTEIPCD